MTTRKIFKLQSGEYLYDNTIYRNLDSLLLLTGRDISYFKMEVASTDLENEIKRMNFV